MELHLYSISKFQRALLAIDELLSTTDVPLVTSSALEKASKSLKELMESVEKGATVILIP